MEIAMLTVTNIQGLSEGNQVRGTFPDLIDSKIVFKGKNNILYCEPGVTITGSELLFKGNNSLIYLGTNTSPYKLNVSIQNDMVFHMGRQNYINTPLNVYLSEQRHCFIGDNCLFAPDIIIRNADPHLIYDCVTKARINPTHSVYIGDHVWIGQEVVLLKGTRIDSGSIVGGRSVATGKPIPHNTVWGGSPAKQLEEGIFWNPTSVHAWRQEQTKASQNYADFVEMSNGDFEIDDGIFEYDESESIGFDQIDNQLNKEQTSLERCEYLIELNSKKTKNRFVHRI